MERWDGARPQAARSAIGRTTTSAVRQEILLDVVAVRLEQHLGAAQVPDLLGRALDHAVALAGLGVDHLAGAGDLEALFRARFGLQLGHLALLGGGPPGNGTGRTRPARDRAEQPPRQPSLAGRLEERLMAPRQAKGKTLTRVSSPVSYHEAS